MWDQAKALGVRPSELYGVTWPLAAFYLDRGLHRWANFVEGRLNEVESTVRKQMRNQAGTDIFVQSAKIAAYNKLMGLSTASAYRQPDSFTLNKKEGETKSVAPPSISVSAEGKLDLSMFNKAV